MATPLVQDRDLGFREKLQRLMSADGLEIRAGWLTGRPKYEEARGGTAVAKVAGVQFGFTMLGKLWDANEAGLDARIRAGERLIVGGANARTTFTNIGIWFAKKLEAAVRAAGLVKEEVLIDEIKVALFALQSRPGTKSGFGRPRKIQEINIR